MYVIKFKDGTYYKDRNRGIMVTAIWKQINHPKAVITNSKKQFESSWWFKEHPEMLIKWQNANVVEVKFTLEIEEV